MIDGLVAHCQHASGHRGWVFDTRSTRPSPAPIPSSASDASWSAETVSSYWTALPVALQHGFTEVALGITRSTDEHNLVWDETGEEINYLWGMSAEAERCCTTTSAATWSRTSRCSISCGRSTTSTCSRC